MMIFRLAFGLLLLAGILCFAAFIATNDRRWQRRGLIIVKWTVLAGLGFVAVLVLERLTLLL